MMSRPRVIHIKPDDPAFRASLRKSGPAAKFPQLWAIGNLDVLKLYLFGLVCSQKCPGEPILRTLNLVRALRDAGIVVISGFHSPMKRECLEFLLRGTQPLVICPATALDTGVIAQAFKNRDTRQD